MYVAQSAKLITICFVLQLPDLLSGFQYSQDGLNVALTGAVVRNLSGQVTNLVNQLKELNDVCTNSQPHTTAQ